MKMTNINIRRVAIAGLLILAASSFQPSIAFAAKTPTAPDLSEQKQPDAPPTVDELERAKSVNVTPAPPLPPETADPDAYYHKYRQSLSLRAGPEWSFNNIQAPGLSLGILYAFPSKDRRGIEAGADLNPEGSGTLHIARRELVGNEKFRPFYKYGIGVQIIGSDQLVTFLRLKNWQLRGSGGFEWTTSETTSFRCEIEPILSTEKLKVIVAIGAVFAF